MHVVSQSLELNGPLPAVILESAKTALKAREVTYWDSAVLRAGAPRAAQAPGIPWERNQESHREQDCGFSRLRRFVSGLVSVTNNSRQSGFARGSEPQALPGTVRTTPGAAFCRQRMAASPNRPRQPVNSLYTTGLDSCRLFVFAGVCGLDLTGYDGPKHACSPHSHSCVNAIGPFIAGVLGLTLGDAGMEALYDR